MQIPYTWGYVDSINRIRRGTGKVVKVVSTGGNQKAKSGGMGRDFRIFYRNVDLFSVFWREQGTNIQNCSVHYDVRSGQN